jgi:drug/metabolite transporter (DMT)-like permease
LWEILAIHCFSLQRTIANERGQTNAFIALGVISTALALVIYFRLLSTLGAVASSSASYLRAAVSVLLGYWFLGEQPSFGILLGLALVIAGVAAMVYQRD